LRLFVAVDVPDEIKSAIEEHVVDPLRGPLPGAKWTRPEGRHLTLKFLGYVEDDRAGEISAALEGARTLAFEAAFGELGGFPNLRRPRVLWVGIERGRDDLVALAAGVEAALSPLGFETEDRPYHPHLTLARFPKPQFIGPLEAVDAPATSFMVGEVVLFRSQLHPKGARYTRVHRVGLVR
jgi:RNA 2',3'-cyclic 3'-phosphodiesterase